VEGKFLKNLYSLLNVRPIICPFKVIFTLFRPAKKPKPEKVGLKRTTLLLVVKSFNLFLFKKSQNHCSILSNRAEGEMSYLCNRRYAPMHSVYWTHQESLYTVTSTLERGEMSAILHIEVALGPIGPTPLSVLT
jgi:hypothetical protein